MKIKTELLNELVTKSINGASNNKLIPITQLMGIQANNSVITIITTDATNYLYVFGDIDDSEFEVTIFAEQFSKLISKMTTKEVELNIVNGNLEVKGNGTYTLELPLDENGEMIKYPDPYYDKYKDGVKFDGEIDTSKIKTIIDSVKPSLATTMELPSITNYFVGDNIIATDRYKVANYSDSILDKEILISSQLMDLLNLFDSTIRYKIDDDCMVFENDNLTVFSKDVEDASSYPIDALENLIEKEFKSVCKVNKYNFIELLERISLFVGKYDDRAVRLYFEKDGIRVSNKNRKSNEFISYEYSENHEDYDCSINVDMLLSQLKAYVNDIVELHYNSDIGIKFVADDIVYIVAPTED